MGMFNGIEDDAREFDETCRRGAKQYDDEVLGLEDCLEDCDEPDDEDLEDED